MRDTGDTNWLSAAPQHLGAHLKHSNSMPSQTTSPSATKPHVKPVNAAVSKVHQTLSIIFLHNLLEWPNRLLYGSQDNRNKNRWKHKAVEEGATNNCAHKY